MNNEDDMNRPVTKRELHDALEVWGGALKSELHDLESRMLVKSDLPGIENRIAQAVLGALELRFADAIKIALKDNLEPRLKRIEDKVFATKRRGRS